jgi:hypothetical protein
MMPPPESVEAVASRWNLTEEIALLRLKRESLNGNGRRSVDPEPALLREPDTEPLHPQARSEARMTPREAAESYIDRGLHPIPIPHREKRPIIDGWPSLRLTKSDLPRFFTGAPTNIGVVLGDECGTADVDLDCPEVIAAAQELLPETAMVFGRQSAPASHYFYRCDPPIPTKRFLDPITADKNNTCIVELRCQKSDGTTGLQTVVPPSVHKETGEQIRFERGCDRDPATIAASVPQADVAKVASVALLARYWPGKKTGRNEAFIALAGVLVRAGWPLDDAIVFHRALYRVLWGAHANLEAAKAEVVATYEKHNNGSETKGRPSLETLVDKRALRAAFGWMGISHPRSGASNAVNEQGAHGWPKPEPMQDELPPVEAFSLNFLPESLRPLVEDVADRMQAAIEFPAVVSIVCLAGVVSRRAVIQPKTVDTDWVVVPNLWGAIVARPGLKKSPVIQAVMQPLHQIQAEWRYEYGQALQEYESAKEEYELRYAAWRDLYKAEAKGKKRAPDRPEAAPDAPTLRRLFVNDATFEALHKTMSENPAGVLVIREELAGLLSRLDQEQYGAERAFYLSGWMGDASYDMDRIGRGTIIVPHNCLSVLGGIQPGRLASYLADTVKDGPSNDGLIPRFQVMVYPNMPTSWKWVDRKPNVAAQEVAMRVFRSLLQLDPENPLRFKFTPDAQQFFAEWSRRLELRMREDRLPDVLVSHIAKYPSLFASLALVYEVFDRAAKGSVSSGSSPLMVPLKQLEPVAELCCLLESHARRIYACVVKPEVLAARTLGKHLKQRDVTNENGGHDWFYGRDVYRNQWTGLGGPEEVKAAASVLQDAGWVWAVYTQPGSQGGARTIRWLVNPRIWQ